MQEMSGKTWPRWLAAGYIATGLSEIPLNSQLKDVRGQDPPPMAKENINF